VANDAEAIRPTTRLSARLKCHGHSHWQLKAAYIVANRGAWADVEQRVGRLADEGAPLRIFSLREAGCDGGPQPRRNQIALAPNLLILNTIPGVLKTIARPR